MLYWNFCSWWSNIRLIMRRIALHVRRTWPIFVPMASRSSPMRWRTSHWRTKFTWRTSRGSTPVRWWTSWATSWRTKTVRWWSKAPATAPSHVRWKTSSTTHRKTSRRWASSRTSSHESSSTSKRRSPTSWLCTRRTKSIIKTIIRRKKSVRSGWSIFARWRTCTVLVRFTHN